MGFHLMSGVLVDETLASQLDAILSEAREKAKKLMHLVRLYLMAFDILEKGEINTYREKDHDFLMDIRNGKYLDDNQQPTKEFYEIVDELEAKLDKLKDTTDLPDTPDMNKVMDLVEEVNGDVVNKNVLPY